MTISGNERLEATIATELVALTSGILVGKQIKLHPASDLSYSLELLIPALLKTRYRIWEHESLDGIFPLKAVKARDVCIEMFGTCILISDQSLTPVFAELTGTNDGTSIVSAKVRVGQPGTGRLGISGPPCNSREAEAYRDSCLQNIDHVRWVYTFDSSVTN